MQLLGYDAWRGASVASFMGARGGAVTNRVPKCIELFEGEKDICSAIFVKVLDCSGLLYDQPSFLLRSEMPDVGFISSPSARAASLTSYGGLLECETVWRSLTTWRRLYGSPRDWQYHAHFERCSLLMWMQVRSTLGSGRDKSVAVVLPVQSEGQFLCRAVCRSRRQGWKKSDSPG